MEGREGQETSYHPGLGIDAFQRGGELSYYHRDEQLSTALISGGQGEIHNSYQYDAFGVHIEATEQPHNRIRYTGQQYDELTGQYYLRARYYNPVLGRFLQEDTYWGDGLNLYAYCGNNPVVYYDPSGYTSQSELAQNISNMTYEEILEALYQRRDEYFQEKVNRGRGYFSDEPLLENELEDVWFGMKQSSHDGLTPHHMPSANSIVEEGIPARLGACSNVAEKTHTMTFTYDLSESNREFDDALYNALSYEDKNIFDQYDLYNIYADTRENADMEVVEFKLHEQYDSAMEIKLTQDSKKTEQIKGGTCK